MISAPGFRIQFREDEVTRQQVRPGTARRVWPYLRQYRGPMVLLVFITAEEDAGVFTRKASRVRDLTVANVTGTELFFGFITLLTALVTALVYGLGGTLVMRPHRNVPVMRGCCGTSPSRCRRGS